MSIEVADEMFPEILPKTVANLPETWPRDDAWCFFEVRRADWNGGRWHRVKKTFRDAKRLANLSGYEVRYSSDQSQPAKEVRGIAGSQAALIYGGRGRKSHE